MPGQGVVQLPEGKLSLREAARYLNMPEGALKYAASQGNVEVETYARGQRFGYLFDPKVLEEWRSVVSKDEGDPCPKCDQPLVKVMTSDKALRKRKNPKVGYAWHLRCTNTECTTTLVHTTLAYSNGK